MRLLGAALMVAWVPVARLVYRLDMLFAVQHPVSALGVYFDDFLQRPPAYYVVVFLPVTLMFVTGVYLVIRSFFVVGAQAPEAEAASIARARLNRGEITKSQHGEIVRTLGI